jgi:hypothetical protein
VGSSPTRPTPRVPHPHRSGVRKRCCWRCLGRYRSIIVVTFANNRSSTYPDPARSRRDGRGGAVRSAGRADPMRHGCHRRTRSGFSGLLGSCARGGCRHRWRPNGVHRRIPSVMLAWARRSLSSRCRASRSDLITSSSLRSWSCSSVIDRSLVGGPRARRAGCRPTTGIDRPFDLPSRGLFPSNHSSAVAGLRCAYDGEYGRARRGSRLRAGPRYAFLAATRQTIPCRESRVPCRLAVQDFRREI